MVTVGLKTLDRRMVSCRQKIYSEYRKRGRTTMRYAGVDLHKTQFSVCWKGEDGSNRFERYGMNAEGLRRFRGK
jgi:hypothetical protein